MRTAISHVISTFTAVSSEIVTARTKDKIVFVRESWFKGDIQGFIIWGALIIWICLELILMSLQPCGFSVPFSHNMVGKGLDHPGSRESDHFGFYRPHNLRETAMGSQWRSQKNQDGTLTCGQSKHTGGGRHRHRVVFTQPSSWHVSVGHSRGGWKSRLETRPRTAGCASLTPQLSRVCQAQLLRASDLRILKQ